MPSHGDLRVWWVPKAGPKAPIFHFEVFSPVQAKLLLKALAEYDIFLEKNKLVGDWGNAGGLEVYHAIDVVDEEWVEWESGDGDNIDDFEWDVVKKGKVVGRVD